MRQPETSAGLATRFAARDVAEMLCEQGWLDGGVEEAAATVVAWCQDAASLLGAHVQDREGLEDLLRLVFRYDAGEILAAPESHTVLARNGAREVIRELAHQVLPGPAIDSDRYKQIVSTLKSNLRFRGRELFHPIRLALAGRAGEGELDRVILLLDCAAGLRFAKQVKGTRERMLEFCAALD
jgi:nondiscriminating glutamyl-tRNA synthetase